jgi:hypothetical protein
MNKTTKRITIRQLPQYVSHGNPDNHEIQVFSDGTCIWTCLVMSREEIFDEVKHYIEEYENSPKYEVCDLW